MRLLSVLLCGCVLPVSGDSDAPVTTDQGGALSDGNFRLSWQQSEPWSGGGCVELSLSNQGTATTDWRVGLSLDPAITAWTWLNTDLAPDGDAALSWLSAGVSFDSGQTLESRFCSEPAAVPTALSAWAITDTQEQPVGKISGTIEDTTGQVWVSWADAGQRSGSDCLELTIINVSTVAIASWRLDMEMSEATTITESWNAHTLADGSALALIPEGGGGLAASESWSGWLCLDPLAWPTAATLTGGSDEDTGE